MARKRPDTLVGKTVCAPRILWPNVPLPKGKAGWEGKVGKKKDSQNHFVMFPGDSARYFFKDSELHEWVIEDGTAAATASTQQTPGRAAAAAKATADSQKPAAAGEAEAAVGKRKDEAGPSTAGPQPSKKAKTGADAAAPKGIMPLPKPSGGKAKEAAAAAAAVAAEDDVEPAEEEEEEARETYKSMTKARLREGILDMLDAFDPESLRDAYGAIMKIKNGAAL